MVDDNTADDWGFASSDYPVTRRKGRGFFDLANWIAMASFKASGLYPIDESTLWNLSASRPSGAEGVTFNWTAGESNETRWIAEVSTDNTFASNEKIEIDFTDNNTFNGTWDSGNLSYTIDDLEYCDCWIYWRVRAEQDHRLENGLKLIPTVFLMKLVLMMEQATTVTLYQVPYSKNPAIYQECQMLQLFQST